MISKKFREKVWEKDSEQMLYEALSHPIRRQILKYIYEHVEVTYSDILRTILPDTGNLNFHLRKLDGLITKTENDTYTLTTQGKYVLKLMKSIEQTISSCFIPVEGSQLLITRRVVAFLLDMTILFFSFGLFLDPETHRLAGYILNLFWSLISFDVTYFTEHFIEVARITVSHYSHVFFAVFIVFTALEAYKGQTLGKYLLKIRVVKTSGLKISMTEAMIRNIGKVFLLPVDVILGLILYRKRGFLRFFDYYTQTKVEKVY